MRRRDIGVLVRFNAKEYEHLNKQVKKSGLSRVAFIRALINGYAPKPLPPLDYHAMIRELHAIGHNLNQLAVKAHTTGHLDSAIFQQEADHLRRTILNIQRDMTSPEKRNEFPQKTPDQHPI